MTLETYGLYLLTVLLFFAHPPGPSQLLFISGSIRHGLRGAVPIMAGDLSANAIQIALAGFGLASLVALSAEAFTILKWLGVAYLVWVAVAMIRDAGSPRKAAPPPAATLFRRGFLASAANPYAGVVFAALFPQFSDAGGAVLPQVLILGATYLIIDGAILLLMGGFARRLVAALGSRAEVWLQCLSGITLLIVATLIGVRAAPGTGK